MLKHVSLRNFKSIASAEIDFADLNVFIGANGSGKSNLVGFFTFIASLVAGELQDTIARQGGANSCLHTCRDGHQERDLVARLEFATDGGELSYLMRLAPVLDSLVFAEEAVGFRAAGLKDWRWIPLGSGHQESILATHESKDEAIQLLGETLQQCKFFQFHDTSATALIKQGSAVENCACLASNGGNLPAFLYHTKTNWPEYYARILEAIRQIFPHFDDYDLTPDEHRVVKLNWREKNCDRLFTPHQLSDGTLRFMALATLLLQPESALPRLILIDEPELGLHPYAIQLLASLIDNAARHAQVILATQSVDLVDSFEPEKIIVAERPNHETVFRRLDPADYAEWLETYSLGDLWKKNVIGGRPSQ